MSVLISDNDVSSSVLGYEPEIFGDITLHNNERLILMLPPKFSIEENLPKEGLAMEQEMA